MRSQLSERLGVVEPQIVHLPPDVHSLAAAEEAIELANAYGVADGHPLDESQQFTLRAAMGEREDGSWAAATVGDFEPRQNGKNDSVAARELFGLILGGEKLIIHTAHEFPTANESFLRLVAVFEAWDDLRKKIRRPYYGNGNQSIVMRDGRRILYKARTGGGVRGFAKADLVVYDEAQHLKPEHIAASGPARLANPNAQGWYAGSGGLGTSTNAWMLRKRALAGHGGRFAYVEHTAEKIWLELGQLMSEKPDPLARDAWARANVAYGRRITDESLLTAYYDLGPDLFARECLCVWDMELGADERVIPAAAWDECCSPTVTPSGSVTFGLDVNPERSHSAIGVADSEGRVELLEHRQGTDWVVGRVLELAGRWNGNVALDPGGPAGGFRNDIDRKVKVVDVGGRELGQACGAFYDDVVAVKAQVRRHVSLDAAVAGAQKRVTGDTWIWSRKTAATDVSPLMAVTVAYWVAAHSVRVFAY